MTAINRPGLPKVVLICHGDDRMDCEGLGAWLASSFNLQGIVVLREQPGSWRRKLKREYRRVGLLRLLDVILFRLFYKFRHARADQAWMEKEAQCIRKKYPAALERVPRLNCHSPNSAEAKKFLTQLQPDITIARCKFILKPEVYDIARHGTFVLHPGICPEYRNAHGCFWALVNRDLQSVGMTLLKVDRGVDTGPVYLQASYRFDEMHESHIVIQYRVVLENLDKIAGVLHAVWQGTAVPRDMGNRRSGSWGQPWLTAYIQWKRSARRQGALA